MLSPNPPQDDFMNLGLVGKGSFAPSQYWEILRFAQDDQSKVGWEGVSPSHYVSPRNAILRGLLRSKEGILRDNFF